MYKNFLFFFCLEKWLFWGRSKRNFSLGRELAFYGGCKNFFPLKIKIAFLGVSVRNFLGGKLFVLLGQVNPLSAT